MSERPCVELVKSTTGYRFIIQDPKRVAHALGDTTLAAFYRCFNGADRIVALEHLVYLNYEAEHTSPPRAQVDKHAYSRNMRILAFLLAGTMYEVGAALQSLCDSRVALKVADRATWTPLDKLRKEWNKDPFAAKIRNNFSHHLGEIEDYVAGIAHPDAPHAPVLFQMESDLRHAGAFIEPWDSLMRSHGIQDDAMRTFIKKTKDGHSTLPDLLWSFFADVLNANGVEVRETMATTGERS